MPHLGIAVATTLGGWLNAGLLIRHADKTRHLRAGRTAAACAPAHRGCQLDDGRCRLWHGHRPPGVVCRSERGVARRRARPAGGLGAGGLWRPQSCFPGPSKCVSCAPCCGADRRHNHGKLPEHLSAASERVITRAALEGTSHGVHPRAFFPACSRRATCISAIIWAPWCTGSRCRRRMSASSAWSTCTPSRCGRTRRNSRTRSVR